MLTKEQDQWIDRLLELVKDNEQDTPYLSWMLANVGSDFTFVCYHAGHTPAMACGILIRAAQGYAKSKEGK
jgi:hypothetical protein